MSDLVPLDEDEAARLAEQEAIIAPGLGTFLKVGRALFVVRDERLYRAEHATFEDYCLLKWGLTDRSARRMIDAAAVVDGLQDQTGPMGPVPVSERQARPLTRLRDDPAAVRSAWTRATDHAEAEQKPVTAAVVEQAVRDELAARREQPPASTPKARRPARPALAEIAKEAGWDIRKLVDRIDVLVHDERYPRNQEQVATALRGHLLHVIETATNVLDHLSDNTQEATS